VALAPVFLAGGDWHGLPVSGVSYNAPLLIGQCVQRLQRLGHRRIAVPLDESGPRLSLAVRQTLAEALCLEPGSPEIAALVPVSRDRTPSAWRRLWHTLFTRIRPTAIIVSDDLHYLSLTGYCHSAGLKIPHDVSAICLESTPPLEWCQPQPERMQFPIKAAQRVFRAWKRRGCQPTGMTFLPLECCAGETIAPPAS
jgi:DNA-binding LacI/PurR family transcriptional regulator